MTKIYRLTIAFLFLVVLLLPAFSFAATIEEEIQELKKRLELLEKRNAQMEKEVKEEHEPILKELSEHITTLSEELDMLDYRTVRIKALDEKASAFTLGGDLTFFLQGIGKNSEGFKEKADVSYSGDLFLTIPAGPHGNVYFRGDIGQGNGIVPNLPSTFSGPNADLEFNEPKFELAEAWYWTEFPFPDVNDRRLKLTIGKMDPTALFDANAVANSETSQFAADIFVSNTAIEFGGDANGYGAGASIDYRFTSIYNKGLNVTGRIGLFEGDGDFKDVLDRPFLIAELDIWMPYFINGKIKDGCIVSEIGVFKLNSEFLGSQEDVELMIRPDDVDFTLASKRRLPQGVADVGEVNAVIR